MTADATTAIAILAMALGTLATRLGGVWMMARVRVTPRIEAFLKHMATSVVVAIVVPATLNGGPRMWLAVAAAALVMHLTGRTLVALAAGIALAAGWRAIGL